LKILGIRNTEEMAKDIEDESGRSVKSKKRRRRRR